MKQLAWIANFLILAFVVYGLAEYGAPHSTEDQVMFVLLIAAPAVNMLALRGTDFMPRFMRLYLQRRALEEQRKIDALNRG